MVSKFSFTRGFFVIVLIVGFTFRIPAQTSSDKNLKYIISGTSIQGGLGLFALPSPDVLPKGKFTVAGGYSDEFAQTNRGKLGYSLGIGVANRLEASASFSSAAAGEKKDMMQLGLKFNVIREEFGRNLLGSIEAGYMETDHAVDSISWSEQIFHGRLLVSDLIGGCEVSGNLGYAFLSHGTQYQSRPVWGGGIFVPVISNFALGVEIGTDNVASSARQMFVSGGIKFVLLDHMQILLQVPTRFGTSESLTGMTLHVSFSSGFYKISPGGMRGASHIPPLPTLEELEKMDKDDKKEQ